MTHGPSFDTCDDPRCVERRERIGDAAPPAAGHAAENCTRCQVLETYAAGHPIDVHKSDGEVCYHGRSTFGRDDVCAAGHFVVETLSPPEVVGHKPGHAYVPIREWGGACHVCGQVHPPVKPKSHKGTYDSGRDVVQRHHEVWGSGYQPRHRGGDPRV